MRYLGGKHKIAKEISGLLNHYRKPGQPYWEPFVGAAHIGQYINNQGPNYFSDLRAELIALWQALQGGWIPPGKVSREMHEQARARLLSPHLTAFCRFGSSYGGNWTGGYVDTDERNNQTYASQSRSSLLRKMAKMQKKSATFFVADFLEAQPPADDCLIYCDPPYEGYASYDGLPKFNHDAFWQKVRALHSQGHTLIVSEYQAPFDFGVIWEKGTKTDLHKSPARKGGYQRVEKLFTLSDLPEVQPKLF
jgi:site-specific DNA-adenine methylase